MSNEAHNIATVKNVYARWAAGKGQDRGCWEDVFAEDASLSSLAAGAPEVAFTLSRQGKSEIMGYLDGLAQDWEMQSYDVGEYVAQGDRVVAIGRTAWRNKATGKIADTPKVDIWRFSNGRAVEFAEFYDTAEIIRAATP
jgi:hypothetical protein